MPQVELHGPASECAPGRARRGGIVLVTAGWGLFTAVFAADQYLSFSLIPRAFFVELDDGRMVSPRHRADWLRDSSPAGAALPELEAAMHLLRTEGPPTLTQNTTYPLPNGATVKVREQGEVLLIELVIEAPAEGHRLIPRQPLERELERETRRHLRHRHRVLEARLTGSTEGAG